MPAKQEPELKVSTSLKNLGGFMKVLAYILGSLGVGAAGSVITASSSANATGDKIAALEASCQRYEVRLSTQETETNNLKASYVDIKKDLAEIRGTSTQILFELQKDKHK